ncbi:hypothetical protein EVAR_3952_1 [Eumeta japonica]|uniref:Uncharacterized protein n=1 Tax=Eumeta variegata TaxID=151549 RepID=A0A4C1SU79_EUMVA|nr:hypothetical protein EVAR_3952_1 [Eumeta japonica]
MYSSDVSYESRALRARRHYCSKQCGNCLLLLCKVGRFPEFFALPSLTLFDCEVKPELKLKAEQGSKSRKGPESESKAGLGPNLRTGLGLKMKGVRTKTAFDARVRPSPARQPSPGHSGDRALAGDGRKRAQLEPRRAELDELC